MWTGKAQFELESNGYLNSRANEMDATTVPHQDNALTDARGAELLDKMLKFDPKTRSTANELVALCGDVRERHSSLVDKGESSAAPRGNVSDDYEQQLHAARAEKDAARAQTETTLKEKDAALAEKDATIAQTETTFKEKDAALAASYAALVQTEITLKEKDAALAASYAALVQTETTLKEKDAALAASYAALVQTETALKEKDAALAAKDAEHKATLALKEAELQALRASADALFEHSKPSAVSSATSASALPRQQQPHSPLDKDDEVDGGPEAPLSPLSPLTPLSHRSALHRTSSTATQGSSPLMLVGRTLDVESIGPCVVVRFNKKSSPFQHSTHTIRPAVAAGGAPIEIDPQERDIVLRRTKAGVSIGVAFRVLPPEEPVT